MLDKIAEKISSGFGFGWKKFRNCEVGKPSDFVTRREALDVEINGGLLNNGKTMMRAYISFVTVVLAIFNFVYVGGEKVLTFMVFAEALFLPLVFFVVLKLFYFLHNSIKQKLYKMDIESFYEAIDLLDAKFAKKGKLVAVEGEEVEESEELTDEEQLEESEEPEEEPEEEDSLDKYDIFKKKNIDVSKLMNETPKSDSTLPFINVDSDYVIKDDEEIGAKLVGVNDNASTIFSGMLQNTSGIKKNNFVDVDKSIAEIDEDKLEKMSLSEKEIEEMAKNKDEETSAPVEQPKEESKEESAPIEESKDEPVQEETPVESVVENQIGINEGKKFKVEINHNEVVKPQVNNDVEEPASVEIVPNSNKFIEIEKNEKEEYNYQDDIASVVSGLKATRSKLASGGMIIERNEPISKRDRSTGATEVNEETSAPTVLTPPVKEDITVPTIDDNTDNVLSALKSGTGSYDGGYAGNQSFAPSTSYGSVNYNQGYEYNAPQPVYQPQMSGYGYNSQPVYTNYNQPTYNMNMQGMQDNSAYEMYDDSQDVEEVAEDKPKKKKVVRTKENEPRPRNLKSGDKKSVKEDAKPMEKRGRPKKQEVSETMVIENDKQFNEVLARAEKLMRKGEEGLSESQTKRIEKEIKLLMDAMNRYKEGK